MIRKNSSWLQDFAKRHGVNIDNEYVMDGLAGSEIQELSCGKEGLAR